MEIKLGLYADVQIMHRREEMIVSVCNKDIENIIDALIEELGEKKLHHMINELCGRVEDELSA